MERNGEKGKLELDVFHHSLECLFGFVLVAGKEQEHFLLVKVISVVVDFLFLTVLMKLLKLFLFILIVLTLTIEIKPSTLLIKTGLLLLF